MPAPHSRTSGHTRVAARARSAHVLHAPSTPSLIDYLAMVWRHRWLVLVVSAVIIAFGWRRIRNDIPMFSAQATVKMVDIKPAISGGLANNGGDNPSGTYIDPLTTEIQVMRSRGVAMAAVDSFGLRLRTTEPGFYLGYFNDVRVATAQAPGTVKLRFTDTSVTAFAWGQMVTARYGEPLTISGVSFTTPSRPASPAATLVISSREDAVDDLLGNLSAHAREMTALIDIVVQANDPYYAQRAANAVAVTLRHVSAIDAQRTSRARRVFIEEQLQLVDSTLRAKEGAVAEHQRSQQSLSVRDKFAQERTQITGLDQRRRELDASLKTLTAVLQRLRDRDTTSRQAIRSFAYSTDPLIGSAIAQQAQDLVRLDRVRDSLTTGMFAKTPAHPDVRRVDDLIAAAETRLANAIRSQTATLTGSIAALGAERSRSAGSIEQLPGAEEQEGFLLRERDNVRKMAERLNDELQLARISEAVESGQIEIVDPARLGGGPLGSGRRRKLLFASLVGLLGGCLAALLADRLNRTIRSEDDVEMRLGIPCLAVILRFATGGPPAWRLRVESALSLHPDRVPPGSRELVLLNASASPAAEAYRALVTNLLFGAVTRSAGALAITSSVGSEGKSTTAANLAVAFAQQGRRVVLVDADLRRARLHEAFESARAPGLTGVLTAGVPLSAALVPQFVDGLTLLPAGDVIARPLEALASDRMRVVLRELRASFDVIIIDTPPVLATADALSLVGQVDGTLLVVRAGRTNGFAARRAVQQILGVGGDVVGAVLNDTDQKLKTYGHYGQHRRPLHFGHERRQARQRQPSHPPSRHQLQRAGEVEMAMRWVVRFGYGAASWFEPTLGDLKEALIAAFGTDYGLHRVNWISRFTDMSRQAAAYRKGRVLLAGDAAHVHSPVGGQGLNTGVQDAVNLGWKLAQVVKGTSPEGLLDTYHAERHPVAATALRNTMALVALLRTDDRTNALRETMAELMAMDEPRKRFAAAMSGLAAENMTRGPNWLFTDMGRRIERAQHLSWLVRQTVGTADAR